MNAEFQTFLAKIMNKKNLTLSASSLAVLLTMAMPAGADISISQVPLSLVSGADPNIIILVDNSTSMVFDTIGYDKYSLGEWGSEFFNQSPFGYLFPLDTGTPCIEELAIIQRTPAFAPLYYDPSKSYSPWLGPTQGGGSTTYNNADIRNILNAQTGLAEYSSNLLDDSDYFNNTNLYYYLQPVGITNHSYQQASPDALNYCYSLFKTALDNRTFYYDAETQPANASNYLYVRYYSFDYISAPYIHYYIKQTPTQGNGYIRVIIKDSANPTIYLKYPGQPETIATISQLQRAFSANGISRRVSTVEDELQNFANWYQYYRTRNLAIRAALASALVDMPENLRIGIQFLDSWFSTDAFDGASYPDNKLNSSNSDSTFSLNRYLEQNGPPLPARTFSGTNRTNFFEVLYKRPLDSAHYITPLRGAFDDIGQYFLRSSNAGPYSATPGTADTSRQASCRRNYTIITTDGYYGITSGEVPNSRNQDWDTTATFPTVVGTDSRTCTFNGNDTDSCNNNRQKFHDPSSVGSSCLTRTGTLSDLAMYYWATDLRPTTAGNGATCNTGSTSDATRDMCNDLLTTSTNPAFWQHMITYGISFGASGTYDPSNPPYSPGPQLWGYSCPITGTYNSSNPGAADDLYHATVNGHGSYLNALSSAQIQDGMKTILSEILAASRSANPSRSFSATRTGDDPLLFLSRYDASNWSGDLQAFTASTYLDGSNTGTPVWSALARMPAPVQRHIHSVTPPANGITPNTGNTATIATAFTDAGLGTTAKELLQRCAPKSSGTTNLTSCNTTSNANPSPAVTSANLIDYLRGVATLETGSNALRARTRTTSTQAPLGDIVNSTPIFVGQSFFPYTSDPTYSTFSGKTALRTKMVYVGSNDGMVHAFRATDSSDGAGDAGTELFTYVPWAIMANLGRLPRTDYTDGNNHQFFVDGPIYVGDAKIGTTGDEWKSILIGTLGAGGQAVYALDVTGDIPDVSSSWYQNAANVVKWEFTHPQLGNVFGQPTILKLRYGTATPATYKWVAALGNGYNSNGDDSRLVLIDLTTGTLLNTATVLGVNGSNGNPNGLGPLVPVDLNGDGVTDYLYAGDLKGNLLRFDVRNAQSIAMERVFRTGRSSTDSFDDNDNGSGNNPRRPITGRPAVARLSDLTGTDAGVVVFFGTGRYFATGDQTDGWDQGFYAVLDRYSSSTTLVNGVRAMTSHNSRLTQDDLVKKSILGPYTVGDYTVRVVDPSKDAGGTARTTDYIWGLGATDSGKRGWYMTLPDTGERSVSTPVFQRSLGRILFGTLVPAQSANSCDAAATGWFMVLNGATGGSPAQACGDSGANQDLACTINLDTNQGEFTNADTININGQRYSAAGVQIQDPGVVADAGGVNADESRLTGNCVAGPSGCVSVEIKEKKLQGKQTSWRQLFE